MDANVNMTVTKIVNASKYVSANKYVAINKRWRQINENSIERWKQ